MSYNIRECPLTLNTTRICGINPIDTAVEISQMGFSNMKPNAVILVNKNEVFDGIAASSLVHFPIDAPVLFTDGAMLSKKTLNEIQRLSPKGYKGVHVIMVGNISRYVALELNKLGLRTYYIVGRNHYETACKIPMVKTEFKNIIIMSGEDFSEGIMAAFWSAHHGDPILYVKKNSIPACTLETIKKMNNINVYIVGSTRSVSKAVEDLLTQLDNVNQLNRIDGENPYYIAVNFVKYKDPKSDFGWGRTYKEGHAFAFGTLNNPMAIISGVILAHMGKHSPLLLIEKNIVPQPVPSYLQSIKPIPPKNVPRPPFMHGFILGDTSQVAYNTQIEIEDIISTEHEMINTMNTSNMEYDSRMDSIEHRIFGNYSIPHINYIYGTTNIDDLFN